MAASIIEWGSAVIVVAASTAVVIVSSIVVALIGLAIHDIMRED